MTPETIVSGPAQAGDLAQSIHGLRFGRFPDLLVDPAPPLATTSRGCSLKRRKTFFKKSISIACCPILRSNAAMCSASSRACGRAPLPGNANSPLARHSPFHVSNRLGLRTQIHSELDQPRVVDRIIHDSKASRLKEGLWRTKLRMVEEVEELSPELEAYPFARAEGRSLEDGEIKIDNTLLAKAGIHARLVSEGKGIRLRETGGVEPRLCVDFGLA